MSVAISVEGLGKQYVLGQRAPYGTLRDVIVNAVRTPLRALRRGTGPAPGAAGPDILWALRDVGFEIADGEVVGIIGRNGSGKSTLLKILSRITEPTTGHAVVRGRVGSLLEVGTGFHPELTGRENVFVNGAILGMRRREILRKFDEIVAFSGVERFIDTPVKHYSSGMQMRLAFAVAAHLEPHILLVDEVLAVGDAEFQRRCLGKMRDVSMEGRTVLLVSHQMGQIRRLCETVIWLDRGRVREAGPAGPTIRAYEAGSTQLTPGGATGPCFRGWELATGGHVLTDSSVPFTIRVHLALDRPVRNGHFGLSILNDEDAVIAGWAFEPLQLEPGSPVLDVTLPQLPLRPGMYRLSVALFDGGNNLTGGRLLEKWTAVPDFGLDVPPVAHPQDEWAGVLNIAAHLDIATEASDDRLQLVSAADVERL
ncbi:MAG: polysaccharide ABC transporter ATP-binding protein [Vicinamibacterales bacterium]